MRRPRRTTNARGRASPASSIARFTSARNARNLRLDQYASRTAAEVELAWPDDWAPSAAESPLRGRALSRQTGSRRAFAGHFVARAHDCAASSHGARRLPRALRDYSGPTRAFDASRGRGRRRARPERCSRLTGSTRFPRRFRPARARARDERARAPPGARFARIAYSPVRRSRVPRSPARLAPRARRATPDRRSHAYCGDTPRARSTRFRKPDGLAFELFFRESLHFATFRISRKEKTVKRTFGFTEPSPVAPRKTRSRSRTRSKLRDARFVVFVKIPRLTPSPITLARSSRWWTRTHLPFSLDGLGLDLSAVGRYDLCPRSGARRRAPSLSPLAQTRASVFFAAPSGNRPPLAPRARRAPPLTRALPRLPRHAGHPSSAASTR